MKFIDYVSGVVSNAKLYQGATKTLIDNSLLVLKNAENDEIIIQGDNNKLIRKIW